MTDAIRTDVPRAASDRWPGWLTAFVALATVTGLCLRIAAARGDLWLDEITSADLVRGATMGEVFLAMPVDNNHVLNSAWLLLVGPHASPLIARLPAIAFGTLCIPVAGRLGFRRHPFAAAVAAALVAADGLLVHFSSEARGYAGLILATFVALDATEAFLDRRSNGSLVTLGLAVAFGTFSHYTMVAATVAIVGAAAVWSSRDGGPTRTLRPVLAAAVCGTVPALACLAVSVAAGGLRLGSSTAFSFASLAQGLGTMTCAMVGMPETWRSPLLLATVPLAGLALYATPAHRRGFPLAAVFAVTAMRILAHVPNEQYARFHFTVAIGFVVLAIEGTALAAGRGRRGLVTATCVAAAATASGIGYDMALARDGRGTYGVPVALMSSDAPSRVSVASPGLFGETRKVIAYYDRAGALTPVEGCHEERWLLVVDDTDPAAPVQVTPPCGSRDYVKRGAWKTAPLSGFSWSVYEHVASLPRAAEAR